MNESGPQERGAQAEPGRRIEVLCADGAFAGRAEELARRLSAPLRPWAPARPGEAGGLPIEPGTLHLKVARDGL